MESLIRKAWLPLFCAVGIALGGCTSASSAGRGFEEPSAGYVAKDVYPVSRDQAWAGTVQALNKNRIAIATSSAEVGQISTDYLGGDDTVYAGGFLGGIVTRYKYNIFLTSDSANETRVAVTCILESAGMGEVGMPFREIGAQNPELVKMLETWMHEQIDKEI